VGGEGEGVAWTRRGGGRSGTCGWSGHAVTLDVGYSGVVQVWCRDGRKGAGGGGRNVAVISPLSSRHAMRPAAIAPCALSPAEYDAYAPLVEQLQVSLDAGLNPSRTTDRVAHVWDWLSTRVECSQSVENEVSMGWGEMQAAEEVRERRRALDGMRLGSSEWGSRAGSARL
jgi:hypothetical protein